MSMQILPFAFFSSTGINLVNYNANEVVLKSDTIPDNFIGRLKDLNTIFTTSGGTLAYEILHKSGGVTRFASNRTSNDNGTFDLVVTEGDRLAIRLTSTGSGVIDVLWHGEIQQIREIDQSKVAKIEEFDFLPKGGI